MKFIILVSNLKECLAFSPEKKIYKKLRYNSTVKIRFFRKKILIYAYVLKNGVGRYSIFLNFYTKLAESSFLCRFRIESVNVFVLPRFDLWHVLSSSTNNFAYVQTLFRMSSLSDRIARVNIEILLDTRKSNSDVFPLF